MLTTLNTCQQKIFHLSHIVIFKILITVRDSQVQIKTEKSLAAHQGSMSLTLLTLL